MAGKLYKYTEKIATEVLIRIADGETLASICRRPGMPTRLTIMNWRNKYPDFAAAYRAAKEASAEAFEEKALEKADDLLDENDYTGTKVRAIEVALGQLRWSATRRDPRQYGQTENKQVVVPIQINTSLDIGQEGGAEATKNTGFINVYEVSVETEADDNADKPMSSVQVAPVEPRKLQIGTRKPKRGHKTAGSTHDTLQRKAKMKTNGDVGQPVHPRVTEIAKEKLKNGDF